jgi:nitroimidazol reductase NimA-like FMN-containing flavoprotein (pyridoxamine 5'-phosphate oxidase superfamily)
MVTKAADGELAAAAAYVYVDDEFVAYILSRAETRKIANIEAGEAVVFFVADVDTFEQIEFHGTGSVMFDSKETAKSLEKIQSIVTKDQQRYWVPPATQVPGEKHVLVKIKPQRIIHREYSKAVMPDQIKQKTITF